MKPTLRKRMTKKWTTHGSSNLQWLGMAELCLFLDAFWVEEGFVDRRALEIGSHMGEGLSMLAASGVFNKIDVIEPFAGEEPFNKEFDWDWSEVRLEWQRNTKWFDDMITLHRGYSYDLHENFKDRVYDFIYIDADHSYEGVSRDIEQYLPKVKQNGIIAGHDWHEVWPGVQRAVREQLGEPDWVFKDDSWIKVVDARIRPELKTT